MVVKFPYMVVTFPYMVASKKIMTPKEEKASQNKWFVKKFNQVFRKTNLKKRAELMIRNYAFQVSKKNIPPLRTTHQHHY